jgi:hypothetical protein
MTALFKAATAALEALEHHTQQTRPIQRTEAAILGLREALSEECAAVRAGAAPVPQGEPYCYIYEYNTALGLHREFYPRRWNGQEPDRSVPVYLVSPQPAPTPQRVPQPLTDEQQRVIQQTILALEELQGPGYLIGGVMHHRIGLILSKINATLNELNGIGEQP